MTKMPTDYWNDLARVARGYSPEDLAMMRKLFYMGMVTTMHFYEKQVFSCDNREHGILLLRRWNTCLDTELVETGFKEGWIVPRKNIGGKRRLNIEGKGNLR